MADTPRPPVTPGAKMQYLIRRRAAVSREELIVHWFANHMPAVVAAQARGAEAGRLHAHRYQASLFSPRRPGPDTDTTPAWDGVAQLWFDEEPPAPSEPHGTTPTDSFQERAEPYVPWATTEYVVLDPGPRLPVRPLTLNPPFPTTRSGFVKRTFLVTAKPGTDHGALFGHWLDVHVPNVASVLSRVGGYGYVVSHSRHPGAGPYAGMAEIWFEHEAGWTEFGATIEPDGMERWVDDVIVLRSDTDMIGIAG